MSEDLKEYMYESQREIIKEVQSFKEEATTASKFDLLVIVLEFWFEAIRWTK